MSAQNHERENESAFIADLLEKLRRQMEDAPADEAVHMDESAHASVPPEATVREEPVQETVRETVSEEREILSERPASAERGNKADMANSDDTPSVKEKKEKKAGATASQEVASDGLQYTMDFFPTVESSPAPAAEEKVLSRTVLPDSPRISNAARHPVDERYRNLFTEETESEPENEQLSMQLDTSEEDLPIPDEVQPEEPAAEETSASENNFAFENDSTEIPDSIWDSVPVRVAPLGSEPIPTERYPFDLPSEEPVYMPPIPDFEPASEETAAFHATERKPRTTLADVDFDATNASSGVLRDKILSEPLESLGGEHADAQIEKWQQELVRRKRVARIGLITAGAFMILLILMELIPPMTDWLLGVLLLTRVPGVVRLIDLQFLLIICLIGYRPIYRGLAALRFRRVIPETLASFSAAIAAVASFVFYFSGASERYLFGLVGASVVFCAILADFFRIGAVAHAFHAYAEPGTRHAADLTPAGEHPLLSSLYPESSDVLLMETSPISRVDGFVPAVREHVEGRYASLVSLSIAGGVTLVDLIVMLVLKRGVAFSFWSALICFMAVLPVSLFAVHRFFAWVLASRISEERIGVTGERAAYRYAGSGVMTFEDVEAFPKGAVSVKGIKLCGDFRLDKALYLVSSLFDRVGGPLNSVFRVSTADMRISDDVVLRSLSPNGIEAQINHEDVCVGTRTYLENIGIEIFRDIEDERAEQEGNRVLYVAYLGTLCAKFYVHYEISTAFEKIVEYCAKHGVSSVILTADPLVDGSLLDRISYISDYDVHFVKQDLSSLEDLHDEPREVELITYGPRKTLRKMPFLFKKYVLHQRVASVLSMVGVGVASLLVPYLLAVVPLKTALMAFLCQLLLLTPSVILALTIKRRKTNS